MGDSQALYSVYIGNLPPGTSEEELGEMFSAFDVKAMFIHPPDPSSYYTYGFLRFSTKEQQEHAVRVMDGLMVGDKKVRVEMSPRLGQQTPRCIKGTGRYPEGRSCTAVQSPAQHGSAPQQLQLRRLELVVDAFAEQLEQQQQSLMTSVQGQLASASGAATVGAVTAVAATACTVAGQSLGTEAELLELLSRTPYGLCDFDDVPPKPSAASINFDLVQRQLERMQLVEQEQHCQSRQRRMGVRLPGFELSVDVEHEPRSTAASPRTDRLGSGEGGSPPPLKQSAESHGATPDTSLPEAAGAAGGRNRMPARCLATWDRAPGKCSPEPPGAIGRGRQMEIVKSVVNMSGGRGCQPKCIM